MTSVTVRLPEEIVNAAKTQGAALCRSTPNQLEYWINIGRLVEANPDLPLEFIRGSLIGLEQMNAGDVTPYKFG